MEKKIGDIKNELMAANESELPVFVECFVQDARSGVKALVTRARKRIEALEKEKQRIEIMRQYEQEYAACGYICGIDEAGRGPLAGPVVAGAVILPADCQILYLNDSKQLSAKKREELYAVILHEAVAVGVGCVPHTRIDEINILQATYEAMREAINRLGVKPDILLNDAVTIPGVAICQVPIIKGDAKSVSIAAASVIAKVTRDRMMIQMDQKYPGYGFASNKGYGSAAHIAAIREKGPCEIHRRTFIRNFTGQQSGKNGEAANEQTTDRNSI